MLVKICLVVFPQLDIYMVRERESRKLGRMGKRRFLKRMGALGVAPLSLPHLDQEDLLSITSNPVEEVPFIKYWRHKDHAKFVRGESAEREAVWDSIPRERWVRVEAAHNAANELSAELDAEFGSHLIAPGVTSRNDDPLQKEIVVNYTVKHTARDGVQSPSASPSAVENSLPKSVDGTVDGETVKGIPVVFREQEIFEQCSGGYYDSDHGNSIPGGTRTGNDGEAGTCCAPAFESDGLNMAMFHCGHVNEPHFHQPGDLKSDEDLRRIYVDNGAENDHAVFEPWSGESFEWKLADGSGGFKGTTIYGSVTWDTIKYYENDTDYTVKQQGNRTGTTSGHIIETLGDS